MALEAELSAAGVGAALGRYELVRKIAAGGMATVYLGRARAVGGFERQVAVKVCHPHLRDDEQFAAMFLDEARLAARIHHPNVVSTIDVAAEPVLFLVMDYVEGTTLATLIGAARRKGGRVPVPVTLRVALDTLAGLHAAHELCDDAGQPLRIVHRDVSPQNILVGTDGVARITDFGIAKAESRVAHTRTGEVKGKVGYMAPEQLRARLASPQSDVYAVGVVLWEALAGRRLFAGDADAETIQMVLAGPPGPPSEFAPEVPRELDAVVMRALSADTNARFASAAAFADALEQCGLAPASPRVVGQYARAVFVAIPQGSTPSMPRSALPPLATPARHEAIVTATGVVRRTPRRALVALAVVALALGSFAAGALLRRSPAPIAVAPAVTAPVPAAPAPAAPLVAPAPPPPASPVVAAPAPSIAPERATPRSHARRARAHRTTTPLRTRFSPGAV